MVINATDEKVWDSLARVMDPEIPVVSIVDLGMVRWIRSLEGGGHCVGLSPTYTGCPATEHIARLVKEQLLADLCGPVAVEFVVSPPWTTDWITATGRQQLSDFGIAPPVGSVSDKRVLFGAVKEVPCPRCGNIHTRRVSAFGSTPCKAHYTCLSCLEPFDYFKCL